MKEILGVLVAFFVLTTVALRYQYIQAVNALHVAQIEVVGLRRVVADQRAATKGDAALCFQLLNQQNDDFTDERLNKKPQPRTGREWLAPSKIPHSK
jgi:hypothetical protein